MTISLPVWVLLLPVTFPIGFVYWTVRIILGALLKVLLVMGGEGSPKCEILEVKGHETVMVLNPAAFKANRVWGEKITYRLTPCVADRIMGSRIKEGVVYQIEEIEENYPTFRDENGEKVEWGTRCLIGAAMRRKQEAEKEAKRQKHFHQWKQERKLVN